MIICIYGNTFYANASISIHRVHVPFTIEISNGGSNITLPAKTYAGKLAASLPFCEQKNVVFGTSNRRPKATCQATPCCTGGGFLMPLALFKNGGFFPTTWASKIGDHKWLKNNSPPDFRLLLATNF